MGCILGFLTGFNQPVPHFIIDKLSGLDIITKYFEVIFFAVKSERQRAGRTENTQGFAAFFC